MEAEWQYSTVHKSPCRVTEEQTLWGEAVCRVWLQSQNEVVNVLRSSLQSLDARLQPEIEAKRIAYADPDNLLTEEKLAFELRGRGFELNAWGCPRYANTVMASVIPRKLSGDMNCNPRGSSCRKSGHC